MDNNGLFYHFDEMGSTLFLTDDSGAVTDKYGITPYGEEVTHAGAADNPFTFLGAYGVMQEGNTGLYYMRSRYYDSSTARFLSRDLGQPLDAKSANPYQYAQANPLAHIDPLAQGGRNGPSGNKVEGFPFAQFVLSTPEISASGLGRAARGPFPPLVLALQQFLGAR